ncbi:THAP domain-containing protein 5-like isoform X2 [Solenopsis invicta]|uniref:THAP domain-containing protein 5-like isoform X2 n=1 Tax=Solenopsis invicta TaxID=13686 RepID=UPI00193E0DE9|nr:THAP domain-containing protein 5-like isoform X2 [Solenopsis invicta]
MGGCSAINCKNRNEAGYQTFRFPKEGERRKKWLINCRRNKWMPSSNSRLCEIHFESFQFEQNRQDGIKKLKPNAIPILFNVPNPPKMFNNIKQKRSADPICMKFPLILQYNSSISCSDENGAHSNSISTNNSNGPNISSTLLEVSSSSNSHTIGVPEKENVKASVKPQFNCNLQYVSTRKYAIKTGTK